jgi:hypothetical protein
MRRILLAAGAAIAMFTALAPASSSEGFQGFLLLIEYQGRNYTCAVTATGQVQECFPLYW